MDLPYSTGNSMFCNDDLYAEKKLKKNVYMCLCITKSFCCIPETNITL